MEIGLTDKQASIVKVILFIQTVLIVLFLCMFFWETFRDIVPMQIILFGGGGVLTISGIALLILVKKWKLDGKIKRFLNYAGFGASSFLIFSILHNLFYAVAEYFQDIAIIKVTADALGITSFLTAIFISPILLIVGIIGGFKMVCKKRKEKTA